MQEWRNGLMRHFEDWEKGHPFFSTSQILQNGVMKAEYRVAKTERNPCRVEDEMEMLSFSHFHQEQVELKV
ncbi:hypothetical protein C5167_034857 [Papaver somniferum]|uniref:Uncharacterized protein n=1 Tax=Papaver somniferum TaxID=3469 RepID=A0A4Y7KH17_PAPSO|nr:hypothetical protein C5167_034857 [Papaver somniferum]